ncbi:hypothetical protein HPB47_025998 [Ixodes persulcatus]|uniref:Uncharacterized protein n=1 Tax=Ixodes persulcatus TaxID=34615 RepID=A0AC60Q0C4_IXOPE|nr:hypothetical protein HPB47_025998 [Ixodes persulcatus]
MDESASIQYALVSEVLKWFVLASVLALGYAEGRPKKGRSFTKTPCWTLLDIGNVILVLAAAALAAFKGYILTWMHWSHPHDDVHILRDGLASISVAVSLVIIAVITILRIELVLGPSGFICSLLGLLVTATITDVFQLARLLWNAKQEILPSESEIQDSLVVATTVLAVVVFANFVGSGICDAVFWRSSSSGRKQAEGQLDEDDFSVFGKTFCVALYPKTSERRRHFVGAMLRVLWLDVFWVGITFISYYASLIARIPILESLVNGDNRTEIGNLVFLFAVTCLAEFLLSSYSMQLTLVFGCRIRSMLQGAIFKKVTRLSPTALSHTSPGQVASMLAVDCFQISMSMFLFPTPLAGILCMPVLLWQLSVRVGTVPTLWCAAWFVLVFLLPFPASRLQKALWIRNVRARDERLKRMGDLLSSIRLVKMYAWEKPHRERVEEARGDEMTAMFFINLLDGIIDSLYSAISSVLIIIVFGTLSIVDPTRTLTPGMSFTCVYILSVTDIINTAAALFLRNRSQGLQCVLGEGSSSTRLPRLRLVGLSCDMRQN